MMEMDEEEFLFWAEAQDEYDEAVAEARRQASEG